MSIRDLVRLFKKQALEKGGCQVSINYVAGGRAGLDRFCKFPPAAPAPGQEVCAADRPVSTELPANRGEHAAGEGGAETGRVWEAPRVPQDALKRHHLL